MVASHGCKAPMHRRKKNEKSSNGAYNKRNFTHGGFYHKFDELFNGDKSLIIYFHVYQYF